MTYTLTHSPDGDYEIVTDSHGKWVAFTLEEAFALLVRIGVTLHPEHRSMANALGVSQ